MHTFVYLTLYTNKPYLFTYLATLLSHKCFAKAFPAPVSSNVTMDLSLLLCSSGMCVCTYVYCMHAYVAITLCLQ